MSSIPIDHLEVSVRTAGILENLGVKTVGELLELPSITAHRLSLRELTDIFQDLGVTYTGQMIPDPPEPEHVTTAEGSVTERWNTVQQWLKEHQPGLLDGFHPGATEETIVAAEGQLGLTLPNDYQEFLRIHNGQQDGEPMVNFARLLKVEELAEAKKSMSRWSDPDNPAGQVAEQIKPVALSDKWVPIATFTRTYLCLDLDPSPKGQVGQVIEISIENPDYPLVANSFADLLSRYLEELQTGEIEVWD